LDIVYEDDHLMIVNKPAGVLTVAGKDKSNNSFVQAVYDHYRENVQFQQSDHMVVHRLGMDVSGLLILAKNIDTVRKLHTHFRTRDVERTYEALVCGHVTKSKGRITLPLMRDYEHPLYVRVSTDQHQEKLIDLDPDIVGKKLLEQPKECITEYKVLSREELNGQPVTRLLLRSVSGRMHQLNCHLAAIGHPIVGDLSYGGINGMAAPNGGLSDDELDYMIPKAFSLQSNNRVSMEQQLRTSAKSSNEEETMTGTACHAKSIRFRHPFTKKYVTFEADAPF
jgi:23S rRNA-/tRNA-specific pseudouridylate synthase